MHLNMIKLQNCFLVALLLLTASLLVSEAWIPTMLPMTRRTPSNTGLYSSRTTTSDSVNIMGGVDEFESWFAKSPGASCLSTIKHAAFGPFLRGLSYCSEHDDSAVDTHSPVRVATVPEHLVLSTSYSNPDWDVELAQALWSESLKGPKSDCYGYCSLLTLGMLSIPTISSNGAVPPSTAPNALRHWTSDQKQLLETSQTGRKLLQAERAQTSSWKAKYAQVTNISWEQFEWCMEVVHSRAFRGIGGNGGGGNVVAAGAPVVAGAAGVAYLQNNPFPDDKILIGLAVLGALPVLLNVVLQDKGNVVLLPLIDSANHDSAADSSIEYNPISKSFELNVGSNCFKKERDKTQLYISYGDKSDAEWLLNYGFLPGVSTDNAIEDGTDLESARNAQRTKLAQAFTDRNP